MMVAGAAAAKMSCETPWAVRKIPDQRAGVSERVTMQMAHQTSRPSASPAAARFAMSETPDWPATSASAATARTVASATFSLIPVGLKKAPAPAVAAPSVRISGRAPAELYGAQPVFVDQRAQEDRLDAADDHPDRPDQEDGSEGYRRRPRAYPVDRPVDARFTLEISVHLTTFIWRPPDWRRHCDRA